MKIQFLFTDWMFWFIVICLVIAFLVGCSHHKITERIRLNDNIVWESEIKQDLFLYFSKTKQVYRHTPFTLTEISELTNRPDPNSVKAVSEGVFKGVVEGLKTL